MADTPAGAFGALAPTPVAADSHTAFSVGHPGMPAGNTTGHASLSIPTPLDSPQWASDFGRQFVSMAKGGVNMPQTAELRLDPPELGPLRISINVVDNVAHAIFVSAHANVRHTLENSLPQLQQLLAQAGISLGQTSVSDHGQPQQAFGDGEGGDHRQTSQAIAIGDAAGGDIAHASLGSGSRSPAPDALVDTFA